MAFAGQIKEDAYNRESSNGPLRCHVGKHRTDVFHSLEEAHLVLDGGDFTGYGSSRLLDKAGGCGCGCGVGQVGRGRLRNYAPSRPDLTKHTVKVFT